MIVKLKTEHIIPLLHYKHSHSHSHTFGFQYPMCDLEGAHDNALLQFSFHRTSLILIGIAHFSILC
jgi:hypothetical protein